MTVGKVAVALPVMKFSQPGSYPVALVDTNGTTSYLKTSTARSVKA